jgi:hypothetical protein
LYLCCFAVHDPTPYDANAFSAIPIPPDFPRITEVIPVEEVNGGPRLYKLFEPYTMIVTPPSAKRIVGDYVCKLECDLYLIVFSSTTKRK